MSDSLDTNIVVSDSTKHVLSPEARQMLQVAFLWRRKSWEAEEMAQLVNCLRHKHENPSLGPQASYEKLGTDMHLNP